MDQEKREQAGQDPLVIGGHTFHSRFILGSGNYSLNLIEAAVREAGAEIIVLHFGIVTKRQLREGTAPDLEACAALARRVSSACRRIDGEVMLLCCGQQMSDVEWTEALLARAPEVDGCLDLSCLSEQSREETSERIRRLSGWRRPQEDMMK